MKKEAMENLVKTIHLKMMGEILSRNFDEYCKTETH